MGIEYAANRCAHICFSKGMTTAVLSVCCTPSRSVEDG